MSHVSHRAIIVTGWDHNLVGRAHQAAHRHGLVATDVVKSGINGYRSFMAFMVVPDGSKEFWDRADDYDSRRSAFKEELGREPFVIDDEGPCAMISWVEVHYDRRDRAPAKVVGGDPANRMEHDDG